MRTFLLLISFLLFVGFNIFPEEMKLIEEKNIYGGKTVEWTYNAQELAGINHSKLIQYFDNQNIIVKSIVTMNNAVRHETGIKEQIQYGQNGNTTKYEMLFTDVYMQIHGFNRLIEEVDRNDTVVRRTWFYNDTVLDHLEGTENKFQFYNIDFIDKEFVLDKPDGKGTEISVSNKYLSIRSIIRFDTELFDLDHKDFVLIKSFSSFLGFDDISRYYSKKVKVYSENKQYWLFVQTQLAQYVKGQNATVRYYPIGRNGELYLICVGFFDLRNK